MSDACATGTAWGTGYGCATWTGTGGSARPVPTKSPPSQPGRRACQVLLRRCHVRARQSRASITPGWQLDFNWRTMPVRVIVCFRRPGQQAVCLRQHQRQPPLVQRRLRHPAHGALPNLYRSECEINEVLFKFCISSVNKYRTDGCVCSINVFIGPISNSQRTQKPQRSKSFT